MSVWIWYQTPPPPPPPPPSQPPVHLPRPETAFTLFMFTRSKQLPSSQFTLIDALIEVTECTNMQPQELVTITIRLINGWLNSDPTTTPRRVGLWNGSLLKCDNTVERRGGVTQPPNSASDELLYKDAVWARSHQRPQPQQQAGHCLDWCDWCGPLGRWRHRRHHLGCLLHHRHRRRRPPPPLPFPDSARPIRFWPSLFSPPSDSEHLLPISCNRHDRCLHWFFFHPSVSTPHPPTSTDKLSLFFFCFQLILI